MIAKVSFLEDTTNYVPKEKIVRLLVVGDGNFSYSWQLIQRLVAWNKSVGRYRNYVYKLLQNRKEKRQKVDEKSAKNELIEQNIIDDEEEIQLSLERKVVLLPIFEVVCTSFDSREELYEKYPESIPLLKKIETKRRWIHTQIFFNIDAMFLKETLTAQQKQRQSEQKEKQETLEQLEKRTLNIDSDKYKATELQSSSDITGFQSANLSHHLKAGKEDENVFDHIIFNHPHTGVEDLHRHRSLIRHFLHSCKHILPSNIKESDTLKSDIDGDFVNNKTELKNKSTDQLIANDYGYVHISLAQSQFENWGVHKSAKMFDYEIASLSFQVSIENSMMKQKSRNAMDDNTETLKIFEKHTKESKYNHVSSLNPFQFREKEYEIQLRRHHNGSSFRRELGSSYTWVFKNTITEGKSKLACYPTQQSIRHKVHDDVEDNSDQIESKGENNHRREDMQICKSDSVKDSRKQFEETRDSIQWQADVIHAIWGIGSLSFKMAKLFHILSLLNESNSDDDIFDNYLGLQLEEILLFESTEPINQSSYPMIFDPKLIKEGKGSNGNKLQKDSVSSEDNRTKSNKSSRNKKRKNKDDRENQVCKTCGKVFLEARSYRDHKRATGHEEQESEGVCVNIINSNQKSEKENEVVKEKRDEWNEMERKEIHDKKVSGENTTTKVISTTPGPKPYYYYDDNEAFLQNNNNNALYVREEMTLKENKNMGRLNSNHEEYLDRIDKHALNREENIMFIGIEKEAITLSGIDDFLNRKHRDYDENNQSKENLSLVEGSEKKTAYSIPPYVRQYIKRNYLVNQQQTIAKQENLKPFFDIKRDWLLCSVCNYYTPAKPPLPNSFPDTSCLGSVGEENEKNTANHRFNFRLHPYDLHPPFLPPIPCIFSSISQEWNTTEDEKDDVNTKNTTLYAKNHGRDEKEGCPKLFNSTRALRQHLMHCKFNPQNQK